MRLRTQFLVLAAGLVATARAADINVAVDLDREINAFNDLLSEGPDRIVSFTLTGDATLTIDLRNDLDAPVDATLNASLRDDGNRLGTFVKTGGGTLQYNGFARTSFNGTQYFANATFDPFLANPRPFDLRIDPFAGGLNGFAGIVLVEQGQLQVSGYLNQWADYGTFAADLKGSPGAEMLGAAAIVVEGGAKLSFRNSERNLVGTAAQLGDETHSGPFTPLVARLNFTHNLLAATTSAVETGPTDDYILVAHMNLAGAGLGLEEGTLGVLEGRGRFYKTGGDALRITNTATFSGEFISAGGRLILDATSGDTLLSALSVNLASGTNGTNVAFDISDDPAIGHWKPGYAPAGQATTLVVNGTQRIRNLQSLFGEGGFTSIIVSGTGGGNLIELARESDILRVNQEEGFDGYFTGSVVGARDEDTGIRSAALGTFIKEGAGALALFSVGNNMSLLEVRAGRLISNVQSLGSGTVNLSGTGSLSIVQNDSGALRATIIGNSTLAELRFKPNENIFYRGVTEVELGNDDAGVADIVAAQPFFFGQVIVEDGNSLVFSSGNNNAFENASRIRLLGGESGRETSIRFNDTDQRFRNLEGDASTRIYLGRGNITVVSADITSFSGGISGVGNLVKEGAPTFTLAGPNTYFGATVVRQGGLAAAAQGVSNTSGLVLVGTSSFSGTGAQSVGSLFGQAAAVVTVGGNLTVGISDDLRGRLTSELANLPITVTPLSPAYYLATENTDVVPGFSPATTLGFLVRQYGLATDVGGTVGVIDESDIADYLDFDGSGSTTLADLSEEDIEANRDLLAFSGSLTVAGNLTKVGSERLRFLGPVALTGANRILDIQSGTLEVAAGVITGASRVILGTTGTYALIVNTDQSLLIPLEGSGTFLKLGSGRLDLDSAGTRFTGLYDVAEGTLAVTFAAGANPGVSEQGSVATDENTTFIAKVASNLSWSGEVYGDGDFIKQGTGTLTLTDGLIFTTGLTDVQQGGLVVAATPESDLNIAAGATFTAALIDDDFFDAVLSGSGTFTKTGDFDLRLDTAQPFTGTFNVTAGSLSLFAENALVSASALNLSSGTTLRVVGGLGQTLANVNADNTVTLEVIDPDTDLNFFSASGATNNFAARILGFPDIIKTGPGKLSFLRPDDSPNEINTIDIQAGELEASRAGLGGADINIGTGATLRFFAAADTTDAYDLTITGTGFVAKSGAGTVDLRDADLADIEAVFDIQGGTLVVSEDALGDGATPRATLANGSTFAFLATNNADIDASEITGSGNLALGGYDGASPVISLDGPVGYTGLTSLVDDVTVVLAPVITALGGLASEAGTTLVLSPSALAVTQASDATFAGDLIGVSPLTLRGSGLLDFTVNGGDLAGYAGNITVDGGKLGLSTDNGKALSLINGATLRLTGGSATNYTAALSGTGATLVLANGTDINLAASGALALSTLDDGHFSRITLLTGSTLSFALSSTSLDKSTTLDVAGGSLGIVVNQPSSTLRLSQLPSGTEVAGLVNLAAATGFEGSSVTIEGDIAGDLSVSLLSVTLRGDVGGDVTVAPATSLVLGAAGSPVSIGGSTTVAVGSVLSGTGNLGSLNNAGAVAPGYSPGTIIVTDLVNSGALLMELGATQSDQILFSGTASLNDGGTGILSLTQFGTGSLHGIRHTILRDTSIASVGSSFLPASSTGRFSGVGTSLRVLLVYPDALRLPGESALASLSVDGEVAAYVVRADTDYNYSFLPATFLTNLQEITEVLANSTTLGANFNATGARLAILADAPLEAALRNLLPYAQASIATGAVSAFRAGNETIQRRLDDRRFDAAGPSVHTNDWFIEGTNAKTEVDSSTKAQLTSFTTGVIHQFGFDGYWGYNLGIDTADTDGASGSFDGTGIRLGAFGGFMTVDRDLAFDFGLSYSTLSGDLTRASVFGTRNTADADATTIGAWARVSTATSIGRDTALTPFAQLETSRTSLGGLSESGQDDALRVADAELAQTSLRAGLGLNRSWTSDNGSWRYRLALEVSYAIQVAGDDIDISSSIPGGGFDSASTSIDVLPGNGFTLAPSFSFGTSPDSTFNVGLRLDQASGGDATSLNFGYRRRF